jgi:hypothetical protein
MEVTGENEAVRGWGKVVAGIDVNVGVGLFPVFLLSSYAGTLVCATRMAYI